MYHCIIEADSNDCTEIQAFLESAAAAIVVAFSAKAFAPGSSRLATPTSMSQLRNGDQGASIMMFMIIGIFVSLVAFARGEIILKHRYLLFISYQRMVGRDIDHWLSTMIATSHRQRRAGQQKIKLGF